MARLRAATRASHDTVDAAFGSFDLSSRADYRRFLLAHARALPAVEQALAALDFARGLLPRTPLLELDLADLDERMPAPLAFACANEAARWGALYVVEGSRLGGVMLARSVGAELPHRYLSAAHGPGQWRAIRGAVDAAGRDASPEWYDALLSGAAVTFDLYAQAAGVIEPAFAQAK
ncbi:biliverdin-producing heme oxygenase [Sphingomonas sp. Mn802worker]|uniref:biliverdin-producing heme oxygenase n=1 Tax=Sphingomonas sp. Mn802worker TaxID=629773 RepID=UPI0003688719|nr:biliverdin-producing heme oxygenase [Sphingomonas sp. Mn802worker]